MSEWISVKDRLPESIESVFVLTDCDYCPIGTANYFQGRWVCTCICQCDKHCETDERFTFFRLANPLEVEEYTVRITHWQPSQPLPEPTNGE